MVSNEWVPSSEPGLTENSKFHNALPGGVLPTGAM